MALADYQHIIDHAKTLYKIAGGIRILGHLAWPIEIRDEFFRSGKSTLPEPVYVDFDGSEIIKVTDKIIAAMGDAPAEQWLSRQATSIRTCACMLESVGTIDFLRYSQQLYGKPTGHVTDGKNKVLDLARQFDQSLSYFVDAAVSQPNLPRFSSDQAASKILQVIQGKFGQDTPEISIVENLSANATASARRIRLRKDATFSQRYINQLIQHEAYIHFATSANGKVQDLLPILAISHPGTTRTQEGLAVFAEFITGTIDIVRLRRLSDRVIAIQMAIDGADFIEVFRFFEERQDDQIQAFENTRRVFRGGVISGGSPFTKDMVYLDGLLRVHNFLRAIVSMQRIDVLPYLFCGKLDLGDIPIICELAREGVCKPPRFLPDWVTDNEFLLSYLAYSSFLNQIDMGRVQEHYRQVLQSSIRVTP